MKIAIVGPTYPFRGGISHYTTLLYAHLRKSHRVRFYTFDRPYPKSIFPGDPSHDSSVMQLSETEAIPAVDWANPFSWYKTGLLIAEWSPDMVILPWWMWGWAIPFWVVGKVASSKNNTKILFICHNVIEHETAFWKGILSKFVLSIGDAFIVHSRGDYENLKGIFNQARVELRCHPSYEVFRQASISKQQARVRLNINSKYRNIILYFGITRPYKGLSYLLQAMPNIIAQIPDVFLIIAGEFWDREDKYLRQVKKLHIEDAVRIINDYIPNEEVGFYFSAVDVVVLPYVSGTGSGIVQMAFGFDKPVIATRVGCLPEVVNDGETGYLVEPKDSKAIANAVVSFYKERKESGFVANIVRGKEKFSWARMVQAIENLQ